MSYNGWKNRETWNVALWIGNDEGMYNFAKECGTYANFVEQMREVGYTETPDNVAYNDSGLDIPRLEEYFADLRAEDDECTEAEDEAERFAHTEECKEGHDYY